MNVSMPWTASNGHSNGSHEKLDDVRIILGREADHLAQVAAQIGRDAGAQADATARDVARDAQKQANVAMNRVADVAAALVPTIAAMGRQRMRQVGEQAQSLGHELQKVRITTEPKRSSGQSTLALTGGICAGIATGAGLVYYLDPERGQVRREQLKSRLARWLDNGRQAAVQKMNAMSQSVTTGSGIDEPIVAEDAASYETWPEGTRVPTI